MTNHSRYILIIDDSEMSLFITEHAINRLDDGFTCTRAYNGQEACQILESLGGNYPVLLSSI